MPLAPRAHSLLAVLACALPLFTACGGSTREDPGPGAGGQGGGTGGSQTGGTGGSQAGGSGGVSPACPPSLPQPQASCSLPDGIVCNYPNGPCCPPSAATCDGAHWSVATGLCISPPPAPCPPAPPAEGEPCGCASQPITCYYGKCADGSPQTIAECNGATWSVKYANCLPQPCEGLSPCDCFDRMDCSAVSDGCICECDYQCPGEPPCECDCGGGTYLGCKPAPT